MVRLTLTLLAAAALTLTACQNKVENASVRVEEPYTPLEQYEETPATPAASADWYAIGPARTEPAPAPQEVTETTYTAYEEEALMPTGGESHTVQKGDTLFQLARRYYNDQSRWKDIWEANRGTIDNPDKLRVGMRLVIP